ncbi:DUF6497 family protein [Actibacterium sp. D379-3]
MMRGGALICLAAVAAAPLLAGDAAIAVPSGQPVTFLDMIWGEPGPAGLTARFRFVAPRIGHGDSQVSFAEAEPDMLFLCTHYALPRLSNLGPEVSQVIITLADRPVDFGQSAPEATQYFEAYRPENNACIWEGF